MATVEEIRRAFFSKIYVAIWCNDGDFPSTEIAVVTHNINLAKAKCMERPPEYALSQIQVWQNGKKIHSELIGTHDVKV